MSTNHDVARFIPDLMCVAEVQGAQSTLQRKLLGVVEAVLPECDLIAARGLRDRHGAVLLLVIRLASLAKLQVLSKKWNPHRQDSAKNATSDQLVNELSKLVRGEMQPAAKASRVSKAKVANNRGPQSGVR